MASKPNMTNFNKYEQMRDAGASPEDVYLAAKTDAALARKHLWLLRSFFNLSLEEARKAISRADQRIDLNAYEQMRDSGTSAEEVYLKLRADNPDRSQLSIWKAISQLYKLNLLEVKEVSLRASGITPSEQYERLNAALEEFLENEELDESD